MPDLVRADGTPIGAPRTCRICGCTEEHACDQDDGNACHWIEPDLCSACQYSYTLTFSGVGIAFNVAEIVAVKGRFDTQQMRAVTDMAIRLRYVSPEAAHAALMRKLGLRMLDLATEPTASFRDAPITGWSEGEEA